MTYYMTLQLTLFFACNILVNTIDSRYQSIVDYYVNLINNETDRANKYQLPEDASEFLAKTAHHGVYGVYDYIVVGAGSAGAVVASRLSEVSENKVLLLEAGGPESDFSDIPGLDIYLQGLEYNWNYNTTPQTTSCLGMINQECPYPRGKGLGGSSITNTLAYARGHRIDYDKWYLQGNPGWSFNEVLPLFIKSENSKIDGDWGYHGTGGYLNVEYSYPDNTQFDAFIEANLELGREVVDYNGKEQVGVSKTQYNTINGRRHSSSKAFLEPARNRRNLEILTHSLVTKVLITNDYNKIAYGVQFSRGGVLYTALVRKEVILSAGVFGSPQILMLSGIGPEHHLRELGIPVIQSLAVGENLHDQPAYYDLHFVTNYTQTSKPLKENVKDYLRGFGSLTISGNTQGIGFFETRLTQIPGYPDVEIIMIPSINTNEYVPRSYHFDDEYMENVWKKIDPSRTFTFVVIGLRPKSRGRVKLRSNSPYDYPLIDLRLFSDPEGEDLLTLYEGIQLGIEMTQTEAFKKLDTKLLNVALPSCQRYEYLSPSFWYCQMQQIGFHIDHPVGTCKMGPDPSLGAVVNSELKVHGVQNLRVADASIMPEVVTGHTHAPAIMIGEKVAVLLLNSNYVI